MKADLTFEAASSRPIIVFPEIADSVGRWLYVFIAAEGFQEQACGGDIFKVKEAEAVSAVKL